jgi:Domain of unknown function (DUF4189)
VEEKPMIRQGTNLSVAAFVMTLLGALFTPAPVEARCGAIAWNLNNNGTHGTFNDNSCDHAQLVALENCQKETKGQCKITMVCENSCCALATGDTGSNSARDHTEQEARRVALTECQAKRKNCSIRQAFCNFDPKKTEKAPRATKFDDN